MVAGAVEDSGIQYFALARYTSDGTLDNSFDTDGILTIDFFGLTGGGNSITLQADGKIVAAGYAYGGNGHGYFALARYKSDGTPDTSFDADGKLTNDFGSSVRGQSVTLQADGKILVTGYIIDSFHGIPLARFNPDGTLDTSFDTDGMLTTAFYGVFEIGYSVTTQADGKILVAGVRKDYRGLDFALARYNTDGSLDTSFDTDGKVTTDFGSGDDSGQSVELQADGKILVAGYATNSSGTFDFALARYNANGSLDTSFDRDGKVTVNLDKKKIGVDQAYDLAVQADGKILVVGSSNGDFAMVRFNTDGSVDTSLTTAENTLDNLPTLTKSGYESVTLDPDVQVFDTELSSTGNYSGATLTLSRHGGASPQDVFSAATTWLTALTTGSFFSVGGVTVGRVISNTGGTLQLGFNSSATQALVSATMQQIAYANTDPLPPGQVQIDWTFSDGNTGAQGSGGALVATGSTVVDITARNVAPVLARPLADVSVSTNRSFSHLLPADAFTDANPGTKLTYSIDMDNGTALPTWLAFDPATRILSGNPGSLGIFDLSDFDIRVAVVDPAGSSAFDIFRISIADNISPTGVVTVSGTATQGQNLTASNTLVDLDGLGVISYQWKASSISIAGATTGTFTLTEAQVGKTITVTASYTDGHGASESVTSNASAAVANVNDAPTGSVTFSGTPTQGQILTATNSLADIDGLSAITYQWKANGDAIPGATASTFVLTEAQVGKTVTVTASYTDGHGTAESKASTASAAVANVNDAPSGNVTISGTATQGQTLSAGNSLADVDGLGTITYQWAADGTAITGATMSTLLLSQAQVGKAITVTASYTDGHSTAESKTSSASTAVANLNDAPTGTVTITGNTSFGQVLTAANTLADLDGLSTISYQWLANAIAIAGATSSALTLTDAQVGKTITVTASYTDGFGTAESVSSSATSAVTNVPGQTVNGTSANDSALTGGAGNDTINGLAGLDTGVYSARMAAYTPSPTAISGPDGNDTLTSIERLQFLDANLAFDLDGNAGQVYRLYQAAFNRTPDLAGLGGWITAMDNGTPLLQIASAFMASDEFQSLYGTNPSNEAFVSNLYTNALHRPAQQDADSAAGWVSQLASNSQTRAQALVNFSESGENKASVLPAITNGILYANAEQAAELVKGLSFSSTTGNDTLIGGVGNDSFNAGLGNDSIDGGAGLDDSVYSGARASYTLTSSNGNLTVAGGIDGTDTLTNVERIKFEDTALAFDTGGNAGQTYRLYQAAFNRTPEKAGLSDWIRGMDGGLTLQQVASGFIGSAEFQSLMGANASNAQFVDLMYANVLHRAADAGGAQYWLDQMLGGTTRETVLIGFSESGENQAALIGVMQGGIEYLVV